MVQFTTLLILILHTVLTFSTCIEKDFYRAAVVEYKPEGTPWTLPARELLFVNAQNYEKIIQEASIQGAEIIVFPEYGLSTLGIPRDREQARPYLNFIPEIGQNSCLTPENSNDSEIIKYLSCAARSNNIYVVVNIGEKQTCPTDQENCHPDGFLQYNTNVVFDRNGTIIAKYHKKNLYFEDQFNSPGESHISTFKTDFGVEFGLFTCYDIIFYDPAIVLVQNGVKNFIFPTAWVDELPFLTAIQSQATWAMSSSANLLSSGYHQPLGGQLGSGIYSGQSTLNYTFDPTSGSKLIIADIPIDPSLTKIKTENCPTKVENSVQNDLIQKHTYLHENLDNYTTKILPLNSNRESICTEEGFCCKIEYKLNNTAAEGLMKNYRLIAFDGVRTVAQGTGSFSWQVCGIIRCQNKTLESCTARSTVTESDSVGKLLPNFELLKMKGSKYSVFSSNNLNSIEPIQPSLNTLDISLQPIPFDLLGFKLTKREDYFEGEIITKNLLNYSIQTIAIIQKVHRQLNNT